MAQQARVRPDPYVVLSLPRDASDAEIRRAYRSLARRYHPDAAGTVPDAGVRLEQATAAYDLLRDPTARAQYDRTLGSGAPPGPRVAHRAPGPTGNSTLRGPGANTAHRPREVVATRPRKETDEGRLLGRVLVAVGAFLVMAMLLFATVVLAAADRSPDPGQAPGVFAEYCKTANGWVPCTSVVTR